MVPSGSYTRIPKWVVRELPQITRNLSKIEPLGFLISFVLTSTIAVIENKTTLMLKTSALRSVEDVNVNTAGSALSFSRSMQSGGDAVWLPATRWLLAAQILDPQT